MSTTTITSTAITPEMIEMVWRAIVEAINPVKIVMFGSQAEGTAGKESDLDLFVIHDLPQPSRQVRRQLGQLFLHRRFSLDLIVRNQEQVAANVADHNPFYTEHIFKRGVVLYERKNNQRPVEKPQPKTVAKSDHVTEHKPEDQ